MPLSNKGITIHLKQVHLPANTSLYCYCCSYSSVLRRILWPKRDPKRKRSQRYHCDYSPTRLGRPWIPQNHVFLGYILFAMPNSSLFHSINVPFRRTNSKIQHGFFELFAIDHEQKTKNPSPRKIKQIL